MDSSKALISNESNNNISVGVQLTRDLKQLSKDINDGQYTLQRTLDELDSSKLEVTLKRNWLGQVEKNSVEENLKNVYSNLSHYVGKIGEAVRNTNDNLGRTLELIKLLALVEKDLYEHLDDQIVSNNELKDILLDWFKKQGINDNEVRELLESSFQRAYTLRDRLNDFRQEYKNGIAQNENSFLKFKTKQENTLSGMKSKLEATQSALVSAQQKAHDEMCQTINSTFSSMSSDIKREQQTIDKLEKQLKSLRFIVYFLLILIIAYFVYSFCSF